MLLQPPTTDHATTVVEKMKEVNREVNNNTENSTSESRFRGKGGRCVMEEEELSIREI